MYLVLGSSGQVARELARRGQGRGLQCAGRDRIDMARPDMVYDAICALKPTAVINAAAYTAVDKAEQEEALAHRVNAESAGAAAAAAAGTGAVFVHISTDYVFDGSKAGPYGVDDPIAPLGAYGRSKAAGEAAVQAAGRAGGGRVAVIRTSWVYSPFGANFVKTMLHLAQTRYEVAVVADQHGRPTHAGDLAEACLMIADRLVGGDPTCHGVFHYSGAGDAVWADIAEETFAAAAALGAKTARVRRISTAEYPTLAARPVNSRLSTERIEALGISVMPWRRRVQACVEELVG
jgi:dTDP-4-dehydrorhamnose reductase